MTVISVAAPASQYIPAPQADAGRHPQAGGGRDAANHVLLEDDDAGADETDAGHDLRRHAGGVETAVERVLRNQHEQGAAQRHDEMRAETGFLRAELALEADHPAHQSAQKQAEYHFPINYHIQI